jgi:hypothetical protein
MGSEVASTVTPVSESEAVALLSVALTDVLGSPPPENVALLFLALAMVESANGKKVVANNPGNLFARGYRNGAEYSVWAGDYWRPSWFDDVTAALHAKMLTGDAPSAFRAYDTPSEGWRDYIALLLTPAKRSVLVAANAGDVSAFVTALHEKYSADYTAKHESTFERLIAGYRAKGYFASLRNRTLPAGYVPAVPVKKSSSGGAFAACALVACVAGGGILASKRLRRKKKGGRR